MIHRTLDGFFAGTAAAKILQIAADHLIDQFLDAGPMIAACDEISAAFERVERVLNSGRDAADIEKGKIVFGITHTDAVVTIDL